MVEELHGDFGGILFGIIDVLTIIPIAGGNILTLNGDGARPSGTTSYISDARAISIPLSSSELKKSVYTAVLSAAPQLQCRDTQSVMSKARRVDRKKSTGEIKTGYL